MGNLLQPKAFERLDQVGHGLGYQKVALPSTGIISLLSYLDAGFGSYSPFVQRPVICVFPLNEEPLYYTQF